MIGEIKKPRVSRSRSISVERKIGILPHDGGADGGDKGRLRERAFEFPYYY